MMDGGEVTKAQQLVAAYRKQISDTPALLDILYDVDLLPEQIVSMRGAISLAAVVKSYENGYEDAIIERANDLSRVTRELHETEALELQHGAVIERLLKHVKALEDALRHIADQHIPDQPAAYGGDELTWAHRQYAELRSVARAALAQGDEMTAHNTLAEGHTRV